jgi:hypothetical protein
MAFVFFTGTWIVNFENHKTGFICMAAASQFYFSSSKDANGEANVK